MPEPTMHCHLCHTPMPASALAEHNARQHPDGIGQDHQVEWLDGTPGPVLVDLVPGGVR